MAHEVTLPNGEIGVFPDDMPDAEIEAVIQKQFPPEMKSEIEPTPFNPKESELQETPFNGMAAPKPERLGIMGVGSDLAHALAQGYRGTLKFGHDIPENLRRIEKDVEEHGLGGVGHILGQLHAANANLAKGIINTPHDFAKYLIRKHVLGATEVPIPFTGKNLSDLIPHIPEDTGLEKALGLEAQPERGDEFTRALPGIANLAVGGFQGVRGLNRWLKAPDKMALLTEKLKQNIANAEETHAATQAETEAQKNALREEFSAQHGKPIGELTPTGQIEKINIKKGKQAEKHEAMAIPEKEVGEIPPKPSTEHLTKKVESAIKASEDARRDLQKTLGVKEHPTHKAGETVQNAIQKVKDESSALYNAGRKHFIEHNVKADNGAEIKSATEELNRLKDADELAPGYGHGSDEQKALESTIEALKGEEVAASDVFDLQQHATHLTKKYRSKAFSGVSELEHKHYLKLADKMQAHADKLARRLESVGGKEVQDMFKEANKGWRTYHEAKQNTVGSMARKKGQIPQSAMIDIARKETGNKFMQALVENDPELRKQFLAAHIGEKGIPKTSAGAFDEPTSQVTVYMKELPEVEEKVKAFQRSLTAVKEAKTTTKAEADAITKAHNDLEKAMTEEAKRQAERQKAHKEHAQLDREIKSHEAAIPKLKARIKAEGATEAEINKAKAELEVHMKALAAKHPRMKKLKKILKLGLEATGVAALGRKIGI